MTETVQQESTTDPAPRRRRQATRMASNSAAGTFGMRYLSALLSQGSVGEFRRTDPSLFTDDERVTFDAINRYVQRTGALPGEEAVTDLRLTFPPATEPSSHYYGEMVNRRMADVLQEHLPRIHDLYRARNLEEIPSLIDQMRTLIPFATGARDTTSVAEEAERMSSALDEDRFFVGLRGVTTGYGNVDEATNGLLPGDVAVLVGRPSLGKTWSLLHMLRSAWVSGRSVMVVSMEMTTSQLMSRLTALEAGVNPNYLRSSQMSDYARGRVNEALNTFRGTGRPPLHFVAGNFRKTVRDIEGQIHNLRPDIVYVDGSYLVTPDKTGRYTSKHEKIADVIEDIKSVAVENDIPIVNTVQFNREVRKVSKADLDLAQIGGTDAIGQIASLVLGLRMPRSLRGDRRVMEVMKNREGEVFKYCTDFGFSPPSFGWLPGATEEDVIEPRDTNGLETSMI